METLSCLSIEKKEFDAYIRKIVLKNFNQPAKNIEYLGGGSFGRAFKVTLEDRTNFVLKAFLLHDMHKKEAFELMTLGQSTKMKYPKVIKISGDFVPLISYNLRKWSVTFFSAASNSGVLVLIFGVWISWAR